MGMDLNAFKNVTSPDINISRIGNGTGTLENIKNYSRDAAEGWLYGSTIGLFIFLTAYFIVIKQYGAYTSMAISSLMCTLLSFAFLASGFSKDISPLLFWGILTMVLSIMVYVNKKKGLEL